MYSVFKSLGMGVWERDLGLCTVPLATLISCLGALLGLFLTNTNYVHVKEVFVSFSTMPFRNLINLSKGSLCVLSLHLDWQQQGLGFNFYLSLLNTVGNLTGKLGKLHETDLVFNELFVSTDS